MDDIGDYYRGKRQESQIKKADNQKSSTEILIEKNVTFESKNSGNHLIVAGKNGLIDFWPSTGKFIIRGGKSGRGIFNLVKLC